MLTLYTTCSVVDVIHGTHIEAMVLLGSIMSAYSCINGNPLKKLNASKCSNSSTDPSSCNFFATKAISIQTMRLRIGMNMYNACPNDLAGFLKIKWHAMKPPIGPNIPTINTKIQLT